MKFLVYSAFTMTSLIMFSENVYCQDSLAPSSYIVQKEIYTNLMGFEIDTMLNTKLYHTISDWLFTGYCFGGNSKDGIDCSDFSSELYDKAYHIKIDGSSASMYTKVKKLNKEELTEGDFVFFRINKNRISHVGVYLSKNKFAHATVKSGVIISDLNEDYYKKYFVGGGRLLPEYCIYEK